jgi:hypothetical protein
MVALKAAKWDRCLELQLAALLVLKMVVSKGPMTDKRSVLLKVEWSVGMKDGYTAVY